MLEGHDDRNLCCATPMPKAEAYENLRLARPRALPEGLACVSLGRPFRHRLRITWDGFTGAIRHRPLCFGPSPMINRLRACIGTRVGNKLGTILATSAPCGHNAKTPRWRRASLGFADFKRHRNLFPIPRPWQTRRTQNPACLPGQFNLIHRQERSNNFANPPRRRVKSGVRDYSLRAPDQVASPRLRAATDAPQTGADLFEPTQRWLEGAAE
jgi:hypothetical protein